MENRTRCYGKRTTINTVFERLDLRQSGGPFSISLSLYGKWTTSKPLLRYGKWNAFGFFSPVLVCNLIR